MLYEKNVGITSRSKIETQGIQRVEAGATTCDPAAQRQIPVIPGGETGLYRNPSIWVAMAVGGQSRGGRGRKGAEACPHHLLHLST
ncbi:unnamed protein product [Boreogadus saida]